MTNEVATRLKRITRVYKPISEYNKHAVGYSAFSLDSAHLSVNIGGGYYERQALCPNCFAPKLVWLNWAACKEDDGEELYAKCDICRTICADEEIIVGAEQRREICLK